MSKSEPRQPTGRQDLVYTHAAVILTGAAVMVVEILGGKLLAPYYGSGIYSWTSIISVTVGDDGSALGHPVVINDPHFSTPCHAWYCLPFSEQTHLPEYASLWK